MNKGKNKEIAFENNEALMDKIILYLLKRYAEKNQLLPKYVEELQEEYDVIRSIN